MSSLLSISNTPDDNNLLRSNRFEIYFSRLPNTTFYIQQVNIPGISINNPEITNVLKSVKYGADHVRYNELEIQFIVQEELENYLEIHEWIRAIGFPESFEDRKILKKYLYDEEESRAWLTINNSYNRPMYRFLFKDILPATLSDLSFTSTSADSEELIANVSFDYSIYKIERTYIDQ